MTRMIESLEARRLLSVTTVQGTNGNDNIVLNYSGASYTAVINGNSFGAGVVGGNAITINGLGGDDRIVVQRLAAGDTVTVDPGQGDNLTDVGNGNFGSDILSKVDVRQTSSLADDSLFIVDSTAGASNHADLHIGATYIDVTATTGNVTFPSALQDKTINRSTRADNVYVDATTPNLTLNLSDGVNNVYYGGSAQVVFGTLSNMTLNGGVNTDTVLFDDTNGGMLNQFYNITPTSVMNQTLTGFENATINMRPAQNNLQNQITISGIPTNNFGSTTLNGGPFCRMLMGTSTAPIDMYHVAGTLNLNDTGGHFFFVEDVGIPFPNIATYEIDPLTGQGESISRTTAAGALQINVGNGFFGLNTGSTDDVFNTYMTNVNSSIVINAGAGEDKLFNSGSLHNFESTFKGQTFVFDGGADNDFVIIDDSSGVTGAGHTDYTLTSTSLTKGGKTLLFPTNHVENVQLATTNSNDNIYVGDAPGQSFFVDGRGGDDFFSNRQSSGSAGSLSSMGNFFITGNTGIDTLEIDDTLDNGVSRYEIDKATGTNMFISGASNLATRTVYFDTENLNVFENNATTNDTSLNGKFPATKVAITGGTGNNNMYVGGGDLDSNGFTNTTVVGGAGSDFIQFNDISDHYDSSESDSTNLSLTQLSKGSGSGARVNYFLFENIVLSLSQYADVQAHSNTATVYGIASGTNVFVNGSTGIDHIDVGAGTIDDLHATSANPLVLNLGIRDDVTVDDTLSTDDRTYTIAPTQFTCSTGFFMSMPTGFGNEFTLNAGDGNDSIVVPSNVSPVIINGDGGNDSITLGGGNLAANLTKPVIINGGTGNNTTLFDDSADTIAASQSLNAGVLTANSIPHTISLSGITVLAGTGGDNLTIVKSTTGAIRLTGSSGDDHATIGNGNLDTNFGGSFTFTGGLGDNTVFIDDHADTGDDAYNFTPPTTGTTQFRKGTTGPLMTLTSIDQATLSANVGNNHISVTGATTPLVLLGNAGVDTFDINTGAGLFGQASSPNVAIDGGTGLDVVNVNTSTTQTSGSATVAFTNRQDLGTLQIASLGKVVLAEHRNVLLAASAVLISGTGALDLSDGDLDVTSMSRTIIQNYIKTAYHFGDWMGPSGIFSLTARDNPNGNTTLGLLTGTEFNNNNGGTFDGLTVNNSDVLVKYTYFGDVDFNGSIDASDYNVIDFGYVTHLTGWAWGDADWSGGASDTSDYNIIDYAFVTQGGAL